MHMRVRKAMLAISVLLILTIPSTGTFASKTTSVLTAHDATYRYIQIYDWSLSNSASSSGLTSQGGGTVTFDVSASKASRKTTFTVYGAVIVKNTGAGNATIGNIIVNLQRQNTIKTKGKLVPWVSIAADMANGTSGESATKANFVASGTSEDLTANNTLGSGNYAVSGSTGTFRKTAGSGTVKFTDGSNNTVKSLVPQITIGAGASVTLLYSATFDTSILPAAGTPIQVETLLSLGNSTGNGNSAAGSNIDINGDGNINTDEASGVLTLPCTASSTTPSSAEQCLSHMQISDTYPASISTTGSVSIGNPSGFGSTDVSQANNSYFVSLDYTPGVDGGQITNTVYLDGADPTPSKLNVIIGYNSDSTPIYATYQPYSGLHLQAFTTFNASPFIRTTSGSFNTFPQDGWGVKGHGTQPATDLADSFYLVYPSGYVSVGLPGLGYSMSFTTPAAIRDYLPANGQSDVLNASLVNPASSHAGTFGGQVLALQLNVDYCKKGIIQGTGGEFGTLILKGTGTSLDGLTVSQVLYIARACLGGGGLPSDVSFSTISDIVTNLNTSFIGGVPAPWAQSHMK